MDSIDQWQREHIRKNARNVTEAVTMAAGFVNTMLYDHQAAYIAEVARSFAESQVRVCQAILRDQWSIEDFRAHVRQRMRHKLFDTVTSQGLIPVALPAEVLRYVPRFGWMPCDDPEKVSAEVPAEAVAQGADWEAVILMLTVPVRVPPVDREAAVKAGILTGAGT